MTHPKLRHVYLPGCWKFPVRGSVFLGFPYGARRGRVMGLWFGGRVLPDGRVSSSMRSTRASQRLARRNRHRASLGPNGTGRGRLKNKHTHHQRIMDYRFVVLGGLWGYDSRNKCF